MRYYEASSTITAGAEAGWGVLSDGPGWTTWDSGVDGFEGHIAAGATVKVRSQAAPGRAFPVRVTAFEPLTRLRFSGGLPLGLFRGVRTYELAPAAGGGTAFRLREEYTGPLLGLIWRSMPDLGPSFERFARGLQLRVESGG
jgi:hypothetical protein